MRCRLLIVIAALAMPVCPSAAADELVPMAYQQAAERYRIPAVVFYTLALVETGQTTKTPVYRPWPWTLTIDSEPHFFNTYQEALARLRHTLDSGSPGQLGVGLYQLEYRFHHHRFDSIERMLDPYVNTDIAGQIFSEYLAESDGNLWQAIGRFHSATPKLAERYQQSFSRRLVALIGSEY